MLYNTVGLSAYLCFFDEGMAYLFELKKTKVKRKGLQFLLNLYLMEKIK